MTSYLLLKETRYQSYKDMWDAARLITDSEEAAQLFMTAVIDFVGEAVERRVMARK